MSFLNLVKKSKKKLVTHDGSFHADDIFSAATLSLYLENIGETFEIIRTRNEKIINIADYVFDVGGKYDEESNRFDHHQPGGAGNRSFGDLKIEYASFGLVWKKYGEKLSGSKRASEMIDRKLVAAIDAGDNGVSLVELKGEVVPYFIQSVFYSFVPGWKDISEDGLRRGFLESVKIARTILQNEIARAKDIIEAEGLVLEIYKNAKDKRIIVLDKKYPYEQIQIYPEPLFVVYPRLDGSWGVEGVGASKFSFEKRKKFPQVWAGLRDGEMGKVSGVQDATFCHRALFMAVAKSREGAIKLAQIAVES